MIQNLNGLEKASVLVACLEPETSARILERLTHVERELLGAQIVKLRRIDDATRGRVFDEVKKAMSGSGEDHLRPLPPLKWLEKLDPAEAAALLSSERPQNIALVLSHLSPEAAAEVLQCLDEKKRNQAAHRLAVMGPVSPEVVAAVDAALRKRGSTSPPTPPRIGEGSKSSPSRAGRGSGGRSEPLSSLEDLAAFSEADIREALAEMDLDDLCLALRVASDELKSAVTRNVSTETADILQQELAAPVHARISDIEQARGAVVEALRRMIEAGRISAPARGMEAEVE